MARDVGCVHPTDPPAAEDRDTQHFADSFHRTTSYPAAAVTRRSSA